MTVALRRGSLRQKARREGGSGSNSLEGAVRCANASYAHACGVRSCDATRTYAAVTHKSVRAQRNKKLDMDGREGRAQGGKSFLLGLSMGEREEAINE